MSASIPSADLTPSANLRRHDLDALRAFAMLLGIVLHASLSFSTIAWVVRDTRQSELYSVLMQALHGFRLPLFFLASGFFTTMLWRRRGLASLLKQRAVRTLVPCLVGLVTIIPLLDWVSEWARQQAIPVVASDDGSITAAVRLGNSAALHERLLAGLDVNQGAASFGVPPLGWAAILGDAATAELLIDAGADVNVTNRDGSTPLHGAAIFGRAEAVALLLKRGADANARNREGRSALDATTVDWGTTQFVAKLHDAHDDEGRLGRRWWFLLPLALIVALPVGLVPLLPRAVTAVAQVVYAWAMSFGMLGLFRRVLRRERPWVRYVSDSSYWLYVTHPPLVIAAQVIVAPWPLPAYVKFVLIIGVVTAILLLSYQLFVRYTWIGIILNGRRTRRRGETTQSELGAQVCTTVGLHG